MNEKRKSHFINIWFIIGVIFLLILMFLSSMLFLAKISGSYTSNLPFQKPLLDKMFIGTDGEGRNILRICAAAVTYDGIIIIGACLLCLLLSIPLGYLSSRVKWFGIGFSDILGFAPPLILSLMLFVIFRAKLIGIVLSIGISLIPYMTSKFSEAFKNKVSRNKIYYNCIYAFFITAILVLLCGFFGINDNDYPSLGNEIRKNIAYATKYPFTYIPYAFSAFLLILAPALMLRGTKRALVFNTFLDKKKTIEKNDKEKIIIKEDTTKEREKSKVVESAKNEVKGTIDADQMIRKTVELLSKCESVESIEKHLTEFLCFELDYHSAILYEIKGDSYIIKSIHKKTIPSELIDLEQENKDFREKAYKFAFLDTLKKKTNSCFVYPGKEKYDRLFHHLIVENEVKYIAEVSYNSSIRDEEVEIDRLRKFIPEVEWQFNVVLQGLMTTGAEEKAPEPPKKEKVSKQEEITVKPEEPKREKREDTKESVALPVEEKKTVTVEKPVVETKTVVESTPEVKTKTIIEKPYIEDEIEIDVMSEKESSEISDDNGICLDFEIETTGKSRDIQKEYSAKDEIYDDYEEDIDEDLFATSFERKLRKGLRLIQNKQLNKALAYLKDAILINPDSHEAYMGLGHIYRLRELYEEAQVYYKKAIDCNKYSSSAYNYLGDIFYKTNRYKQAVKAWERALSYDPGRILIKKNIEKLKKMIDKRN